MRGGEGGGLSKLKPSALSNLNKNVLKGMKIEHHYTTENVKKLSFFVKKNFNQLLLMIHL